MANYAQERIDVICRVSRYPQRTGYFISVSERYAQINRRRALQRWNDDGLEILEWSAKDE